MRWIRAVDKYFEESLAVVLFSVMIGLTFAQVLFRFVLDASLDWSEELSRYTFVWLVYLSAVMAVKHQRHIRVEFAEKMLPRQTSKWIGLLSDLLWLAFAIFMFKEGYVMADKIMTFGQTSPANQLSMGLVYMIVPLGFILMSIRIVQNIYKRLTQKDTETEEDIADYTSHI